MLEKLLVGMLVAGFAGALPRSASADDAAAAKVAFDEGRELFHAEQYAEASESFRRAYELKQSWKLLFNIAQCEAGARRYGLAVEAFERYLAQGGDEVPRERLDEVLAEVERLRKMVGSLEVRGPRGGVVEVDGVERGRLPLSGRLLVAAGVEHWVLVKRLEEIVLDKVVRVSGGQVMSLEATAAREPGAGTGGAEESREGDEPERALPEAEPGSPLRTGGWVSVGLGGALLLAGGIVGGAALSLDAELDEACADGGCPPGRADDIEKVEGQGVAADVLLVVGLAAAAAGVALLVVDAKKEESPKAALTPTVGPGYAGLSLGGRF